jgi:small-conductance mechanosensitive channel
MLTLLLGFDVLITSWIAAHLLAAVSAYFLMRTDTVNSVASWLEQEVPGFVYHRNARKITFLLLIVSIGGILTVMLNLNPIQDNLLAPLLNLPQDDPNLIRFFSFLDNLLIVLGIILLMFFIPIINTIFTKLYRIIDGWRHTRFRVIKIQRLELLTPDQLASLFIMLAKYVRLVILFLVAAIAITLVFSLYPVTRGIAQSFSVLVLEALNRLWEGTLSFLPNLITLGVIIAITRLVLKILHFFYEGFIRGKVRYSGIHPELVSPTYQLMRFLVIAFALVAAFPYIPGSSSPVFRGISIFVGFLLSLGSTSLVTNIVSGVVLTYTRGLKVGDRVMIADSVGDVIDRTLLVTRIRTIKNVVITIPNGMVMQNQIVNYSASAQQRGLILHTGVSIGYDVPWRQVHQLLIDAAADTPDVLQYPAPFVLQTSLDDFYVSYELNAYTAKPSKMAEIYSQLHQNILDKFNAAGVEIMSPSYFAYRDGQPSTIPEFQTYAPRPRQELKIH